MNNAFVFFASGDLHTKRLQVSLNSYRRFSDAELIAVVANTRIQPTADSIVKLVLGDKDVRLAKLCKTSIASLVPPEAGRVYCYVDNDTFAVSEQVDEIFTFKRNIVNFAPDPGKTVKKFTKYALKTRTVSLDQAIENKFGVRVDPLWLLFNGGVFLYDSDSLEFLSLWHNMTKELLADSKWQVRDQSSLIAAIWKMGLQDAERIPSEFNWLHKLQGGCRISGEQMINKNNKRRIHIIHFPVSYGKSESWSKALELSEMVGHET